MAITRVHNFNMAGAMVSSGEEDPTLDEDPTANLPPGTRVHVDGQIDDAASRPVTDAEIQQITGRPPMRPIKPKRAPAAAGARRATPDGFVSDRRRCLELAVAAGETDPDKVLAIAGRFLGFLLEEELT